MSSGVRTIVVGFDALDFAYLDRFAESLPTFRRLRKDGIEASLESTLPPWTGSAWPSMYTGTDPSYHGVYDFFANNRYPDKTTVITRNDVCQPAIWNYLSDEGIPSVVLNVPVTHPAEPIEGALIPGYLAPEDVGGYPDGIRDDLSAALGEEYRIYSRAETAADPDEKLTGYLELIDLRRRAATELLTSREWEVAILEVQKTDAVFHNFDDEAAHRQVYRAADEFLASILDAVDQPVNVVVCSDHGMGRKRGYAIYLNEILRDHGYVEAVADGSERSLASVKTELTGEAGDDGSRRGQVARAATGLQSALRRVGVTPADVYAAARRLGIGDALKAAVPSDVVGETAKVVDWHSSAAYCRSSAELGVRINLEGREPAGQVPRERYDEVRASIIELLRDVRTPDGRPAFERVVPREHVYDGPFVDKACDVVVVPRGMNNTIGTKIYGRHFHGIDLYDHKPAGVFVASGPYFETDVGISSLSLVDVAPIIFGLCRRPVPDRMTGTVPDGLVSRSVSTGEYGDIDYGTSSHSDLGEDSMTERLQDLGYL